MALDAKKVYALSKKYTDDTVEGGGAIKGKNCVISDISAITGGNRVTFQWTLDNGTVQTGILDVMNGSDGQDGAPGQNGNDGIGIKSIEVNSNNHLIITYSDDSTEDAGTIKTIKGDDGFSPTIVVKESTAERYVLTITDATHSYDTPNLKGSGGGGGASEMSDLSDVSLVNTQTGDILVLDKTDPDNPVWENSNILSDKQSKITISGKKVLI